MKEDEKWISKISYEFSLSNDEVKSLQDTIEFISKGFKDNGLQDKDSWSYDSLYDVGTCKIRIRGLFEALKFLQDLEGTEIQLTEKEVNYLCLVPERSTRQVNNILKEDSSLTVSKTTVKPHKGKHGKPKSKAKGSPGRPQNAYKLADFQEVEKKGEGFMRAFPKLIDEYIELESDDMEVFDQSYEVMQYFLEFSTKQVMRPILYAIVFLINNRGSQNNELEALKSSELSIPKKAEFDPSQILKDAEPQTKSLRLNPDDEAIEILSERQLEPDDPPYLFRGKEEDIAKLGTLLGVAIDLFESLQKVECDFDEEDFEPFINQLDK